VVPLPELNGRSTRAASLFGARTQSFREQLGDLVPANAAVEHHANDVGAPVRLEERWPLAISPAISSPGDRNVSTQIGWSVAAARA
jgi:hypothetical protein